MCGCDLSTSRVEGREDLVAIGVGEYASAVDIFLGTRIDA